MVTTSCNYCGAIERTLASMGSKCYWCGKGIMKLKELASYE